MSDTSSVWEKRFSNKFNTDYWFNKVTEESVWEDPTNLPIVGKKRTHEAISQPEVM